MSIALVDAAEGLLGDLVASLADASTAPKRQAPPQIPLGPSPRREVSLGSDRGRSPQRLSASRTPHRHRRQDPVALVSPSDPNPSPASLPPTQAAQSPVPPPVSFSSDPHQTVPPAAVLRPVQRTAGDHLGGTSQWAKDQLAASLAELDHDELLSRGRSVPRAERRVVHARRDSAPEGDKHQLMRTLLEKVEGVVARAAEGVVTAADASPQRAASITSALIAERVEEERDVALRQREALQKEKDNLVARVERLQADHQVHSRLLEKARAEAKSAEKSQKELRQCAEEETLHRRQAEDKAARWERKCHEHLGVNERLELRLNEVEQAKARVTSELADARQLGEDEAARRRQAEAAAAAADRRTADAEGRLDIAERVRQQAVAQQQETAAVLEKRTEELRTADRRISELTGEAAAVRRDLEETQARLAEERSIRQGLEKEQVALRARAETSERMRMAQEEESLRRQAEVRWELDAAERVAARLRMECDELRQHLSVSQADATKARKQAATCIQDLKREQLTMRTVLAEGEAAVRGANMHTAQALLTANLQREMSEAALRNEHARVKGEVERDRDRARQEVRDVEDRARQEIEEVRETARKLTDRTEAECRKRIAEEAALASRRVTVAETAAMAAQQEADVTSATLQKTEAKYAEAARDLKQNQKHTNRLEEELEKLERDHMSAIVKERQKTELVEGAASRAREELAATKAVAQQADEMYATQKESAESSRREAEAEACRATHFQARVESLEAKLSAQSGEAWAREQDLKDEVARLREETGRQLTVGQAREKFLEEDLQQCKAELGRIKADSESQLSVLRAELQNVKEAAREERVERVAEVTTEFAAIREQADGRIEALQAVDRVREARLRHADDQVAALERRFADLQEELQAAEEREKAIRQETAVLAARWEAERKEQAAAATEEEGRLRVGLQEAKEAAQRYAIQLEIQQQRRVMDSEAAERVMLERESEMSTRPMLMQMTRDAARALRFRMGAVPGSAPMSQASSPQPPARRTLAPVSTGVGAIGAVTPPYRRH
eukprot:Hpha_TRINITY_DN15821_c4_g7::TRINITY_DN15821_c4_g7_i1::g.188623::m.188623